jgi:hypothetical protein
MLDIYSVIGHCASLGARRSEAEERRREAGNGRQLRTASPPAGAGGEPQLRHREHGRRGRAAVAAPPRLIGGPAPVRRRQRERARTTAAEAHHEHHLPNRHRWRQRVPHREPRLRVRIFFSSFLIVWAIFISFVFGNFFVILTPLNSQKDSFFPSYAIVLT